MWSLAFVHGYPISWVGQLEIRANPSVWAYKFDLAVCSVPPFPCLIYPIFPVTCSKYSLVAEMSWDSRRKCPNPPIPSAATFLIDFNKGRYHRKSATMLTFQCLIDYFLLRHRHHHCWSLPLLRYLNIEIVMGVIRQSPVTELFIYAYLHFYCPIHSPSHFRSNLHEKSGKWSNCYILF